jgi:hypothetical protein
LDALDKLNQLVEDLIKRRRGDHLLYEKEIIREWKTAEALPKLVDKTGFKVVYDDATAGKFSGAETNEKDVSTTDTTKKPTLYLEDIMKY